MLQSKEAKFLELLLERFAKTSTHSSFRMLLSSCGSLIKLVDSSHKYQEKVKEVLDFVRSNWDEAGNTKL